jgi:uncharacterized protein YqeY
MTLEKLQSEMIQARKNKDKVRLTVISEMIDAVRKAAIPKSKDDPKPEINEQFVDNVLLKFQKTIKEMVDTCPTNRAETLENYKMQLNIVNEFVPTLITDETEIRYLILDIVNNEHEFSKANRGKIMKIVAPALKGKVDMSIVNKVLGGMLQ